MKALWYLCFIYFMTAAAATAQAQSATTMHNTLLANENGARFNEYLDWESFQQLPRNLQMIAVASLMAQPDFKHLDGDGTIVFKASDRPTIMNYFYYRLSVQDKEQIQGWAYDLSVVTPAYQEQIAQADQYFEKLAQKNPELARQRLCAAIESTANGYDYPNGISRETVNRQFARLEGSLNSMMHAVGNIPNVADMPCQIQVGSQKFSYTPRQAIANSKELNLNKYLSENRTEVVTSEIIIKKFSSCTAPQLKAIFDQGVVSAKLAKVGGGAFVINQIDSCIVDGYVQRLEKGYRFFARNQNSRLKTESIPFEEVTDLVAKLKNNQVSYQTTKTQLVQTTVTKPVVTVPQPTQEKSEDLPLSEILKSPWKILRN